MDFILCKLFFIDLNNIIIFIILLLYKYSIIILLQNIINILYINILHTSFIYNLLYQILYFTKSKDKIFVSIYTNKIKSILSNNGFDILRNKFPFLHEFIFLGYFEKYWQFLLFYTD